MDKVANMNSTEVGSYLFAIVKNYCRTLLRDKKYELIEEDIEDLDYKISDERFSLEDQVVAEDSARRLVNLIGTLKENYREAFLLRYSNNMSNAEIAQFLNISKNHVAVRINRAKNKLKKVISAERSTDIGNKSK